MENKLTKYIARIKKLYYCLSNLSNSFLELRKKPLFQVAGLALIGFCTVIYANPHEAFNSVFRNKQKLVEVDSNPSEKIDSEMVLGVSDEIVDECDNNSNFIDNQNEWIVDEWWTKENNSSSFIYRKINRGGPRMTYCNKEIYNNFDISFKFSPISNEGNALEEINIIIYVGSLYSIILDQNRDKNEKVKNTYLSVFDNNEKYIYIEDDSKTKREKIHLDNKVPFNKFSRITIKQDCHKGDSVQFVSLSIEYTPDKLKNANAELETVSFEIEDSFCDNKNIFSIGLLQGRSDIIITKFDDFILQTHKE